MASFSSTEEADKKYQEMEDYFAGLSDEEWYEAFVFECTASFISRQHREAWDYLPQTKKAHKILMHLLWDNMFSICSPIRQVAYTTRWVMDFKEDKTKRSDMFSYRNYKLWLKYKEYSFKDAEKCGEIIAELCGFKKFDYYKTYFKPWNKFRRFYLSLKYRLISIKSKVTE